MGRPTKYTIEIADHICEKLADGITLTEICGEDDMPGRRTVYDWMEGEEDWNKAFSARIARAREAGFDEIAEDCLRIADDNSRDVQEYEIAPGVKGTTVDYEVIQRSKLRVETRLKLLAKWSPKKYGDKVQTEHSGEIGIKQITGMEIK